MANLSMLAIIATTLQSVLFGFALLMFILTMYILLQDRRRRRLNRAMIGASGALILLATIELACNILRLYNGFLRSGPKHFNGSEGYFADVSETTYIVKGALYNGQTLILDAVVIYRAWVVWQKLWVVLLPGAGWCALLSCCIGLNHALVLAPANTDNVFGPLTRGWITAVYATTLGTNIIATALLAYRIWRVNRRAAEFVPSDRLTVILHVVLESGFIYSATIVAALIAFIAGSRLVYVLLDLISPIISIVFNMIIVRVGLAAGRGGLPVVGIDSAGHNSDLEFAATNPRPPTFRAGRRNSNGGVELKSMTVDLTTCRDADAASVHEQDVKLHGTLGTSSSESDATPRKSRSSL